MGDALGGLLNATFGNAVELLISILALVKGEIGLVQASMIGSILSNSMCALERMDIVRDTDDDRDILSPARPGNVLLCWWSPIPRATLRR